MFSDLHSLHDPLWRRGKLRRGQGQGPAQSGQTAHPSQLCCPDCLIHSHPPYCLSTDCLKACSLGTSKEHISQHRKCQWLLALAPASSLLLNFCLDSWNPLGVKRFIQRPAFLSLPCFSTQIFRELAENRGSARPMGRDTSYDFQHAGNAPGLLTR